MSGCGGCGPGSVIAEDCAGGCECWDWSKYASPIPILVRCDTFAAQPPGGTKLPLPVEQGSTLSVTFEAFKDILRDPCYLHKYPFGKGRGPCDLTGWTGEATIAKVAGHPMPTPLTVTISGSLVTVSATAIETRTFPTFGVWSLVLTDPAGVKRVVVRGDVCWWGAVAL